MILRTALFVSLVALPAAAQHEHPPQPAPAPQTEAGHHAILEMERGALERGEGMGMAMAADKNGYPGPKHVLELKEQLKLTPEQEAEMNRLMVLMKEQAVALGKEVLAAEAELESMFAACGEQGRTTGCDESVLRAQVERIAALRAKVRWVHLGTHLAARKTLTAEQIRTYTRLRYPPQRTGHGH